MSDYRNPRPDQLVNITLTGGPLDGATASVRYGQLDMRAYVVPYQDANGLRALVYRRDPQTGWNEAGIRWMFSPGESHGPEWRHT